MGENKKRWFIAGIAIRRKSRNYMRINNIPFTEDKGLIESVFYLNCDDATYESLYKFLSAIGNQKS